MGDTASCIEEVVAEVVRLDASGVGRAAVVRTAPI